MAVPMPLGLYGSYNEDGEQHEHRKIIIERLLLYSYNDAFNFPDHVLMVIYQLPRRFILNMINVLRPFKYFS